MYKPSSSTRKATADFVPKKRGIVPSANSAFKRTVSSFAPAKRQRKDPVPVRKRQSLADIVRQFDEEDEQEDLARALANSLETPAGVESVDIPATSLAVDAERWEAEVARRAEALGISSAGELVKDAGRRKETDQERVKRVGAVMEEQLALLNSTRFATARPAEPVVPEAESTEDPVLVAAGEDQAGVDDAERPSRSAIVDSAERPREPLAVANSQDAERPLVSVAETDAEPEVAVVVETAPTAEEAAEREATSLEDAKRQAAEAEEEAREEEHRKRQLRARRRRRTSAGSAIVPPALGSRGAPKLFGSPRHDRPLRPRLQAATGARHFAPRPLSPTHAASKHFYSQQSLMAPGEGISVFAGLYLEISGKAEGPEPDAEGNLPVRFLVAHAVRVPHGAA